MQNTSIYINNTLIQCVVILQLGMGVETLIPSICEISCFDLVMCDCNPTISMSLFPTEYAFGD